MAYNVEMTFYRTGKQAWSTFIPEYSNTDTKVLGEIFEPYDILSPTIIINNEAMIYPEGHIPYTINEYNYVYIDTLDRYYWIKDWVRNNGLWYGYCAEDVLASFRSDILNTTQYVLRSSTTYDNSIIDYNYTYKLSDYIVNSVGMDRVEGGSGSWISLSDFRPEQHPNDHMLIINVNPCGASWTPNSTTGNRLSDYSPNILALRADNYSRLLSAIKSTDVENVQLANYINNAYWIPIPFNEISHVENYVDRLYFGSYVDAKGDGFNTDGAHYLKTWNKLELGGAWAIQPNHNIDCVWEGTIPDISNITYENSADYKTVMLRFHPFGEFPLDSNLLAGTTKIRVRVSLNVATGMAELSYRQQAPNIGSYIVLSNTNIAVPIQMSTIVNNYTDWHRQHIANWVQLGVAATGAAGRAVAMQGKLASGASGAFGNGNAAQAAVSTAGNLQQVTGEGIATIGADAGSLTNAIVNLIAEKPVQFASQVSGAYGSTLMDYNPIIITYRNKIVDRMDNRFGRPLCKPMKLGDLGGGVCVCQNAVFGGKGIGNRALLSERQAIEQALNGGIYID